MDNQPIVSVIIPVHNAQKYLKKCLNSVINQTLKNIQIICVDDGSTDRSLSILNKYKEKDSRIVVVTQENKNAGAARNNGMQYATGKYYSFLDSDDFFEKEMLESAVNNAEKYNADVVHFGASKYDSNTHRKSNTFCVNRFAMPLVCPFSAKQAAGTVFQITNPAPWNKIFNAEYIKKQGLQFQEQSNANDLYFVMSALCGADRISYVEKNFVNYRVGNSSSLQATKSKNPENFYNALMALKERMIKSGTYALFERSFCEFADASCDYNFKSFSEDILSNEKRIDMRKTLKEYPGNDRPDMSVVVAVYNTEKYLPGCLESIVSQKGNIEIICVDDGSSDGSFNIIDDYSKKDRRIKVIRKPENEGLLLARKDGALSASGRYVTFVDSDDELMPGACEKMCRLMDESKTDIGQFGIKVENRTGMAGASWWHESGLQPLKKSLYGKELFDSFFIKRENMTAIVGKAFSRELCTAVYSEIPDIKCYVGEDIITYYFMCLYGVKYKGFPDDIVYRYNYGLGVGNTDIVKVGKFEKYCNMSILVNYVREYIADHSADELSRKAADCMEIRMIDDCFRIFNGRIAQDDKSCAASLMLEAWGKSEIFDTKMKEIFNYDIKTFKKRFIDVPVYVHESDYYKNGIIPKVSVVVPVYNVSDYLEDCLNSIINQTMQDIEIICVNDGSTDDSLEILERYAEKDNRITIISKLNGGPSSARNSGIEKAKGKYIYFIDSDDMITLSAMEDVYKVAEADDLDIVLFEADSIFEDDEIKEGFGAYDNYYLRKFTTGVISGSELAGKYCSLDAYRAHVAIQLFKRDFLEKNNLRFYYGLIYEDELFSPFAIVAAERIKIIHGKYYIRRVRHDSIMTKKISGKQVVSRAIIGINMLREAAKYPDHSNEHDFLFNCGKVSFDVARKILYEPEWEDLSRALSVLTSDERYIFDRMVIYEHPLKMVNTNSASYRIGRTITYVPRKIRGGIYCLKDNGLKYTVNRFGEKIKNKIGKSDI